MRTEIIRSPRRLAAGEFFVKGGYVGLAARDAEYLEEGLTVTWGGAYRVEVDATFEGPASLISGQWVPTPVGGEEHGIASPEGDVAVIIELHQV